MSVVGVGMFSLFQSILVEEDWLESFFMLVFFYVCMWSQFGDDLRSDCYDDGLRCARLCRVFSCRVG